MSSFLPAIVDGVLQRTSASQIELFNAADNPQTGCERKWFFNKKLRKPIPSGKAAEAGSNYHKNIEDHLKGKPIEFGPYEKELARFMPEPLDIHNRPEVSFEKILPVEGDPCTLIGKIDVLNDSGEWLDNEGVHRKAFANEVEIIDWKFTGSIEHRAETPKSLATDLAMNIYGAYALENPGTDWVRLSHCYSQTKSPKRALKVSALVNREQIEDRFKLKVMPLVQEMRQAARITDFKDIPANRGACYAFGQRCPFFAECQTGSVEMFGDFLHTKLEGDSTVSLLSAMLPKTLPATPAPSSLPPVGEGAAVRQAVASSSPPLVTAGTDQQSATSAPAASKLEVGILPPDAPPIDPVLATVGTDGQFHLDASGQLYRYKKGQWSFAGASDKHDFASEGDLSIEKLLPPEVTDNVIPIKRGRGRPPKIKPEAVPSNDGSATPTTSTASVGLSTVETAPAPSTPEAKEAPNSRNVNGTVGAARPGPTTPQASGVELYIRAITNLPAKPLEVYARAISEKLADTCGQPGMDIRCSKHPSLSHGSWKGALASAIRQFPPDKGIYTLMSRGEFYDILGDTVAEFADHVVRGVA